MFDTIVDLSSVVTQMETLLHIDNSDYDLALESAVRKIFNRLNHAFAIDFNNVKITDPALTLKGTTQVANWISNLYVIYADLAAFGALERYHNRCTVRPKTVGYLGFTRESLLDTLSALVREEYEATLDTHIQSMGEQLAFAAISIERKLLFIMIICYYIGMYEMSAVIADLFIAGIMGGN